MALYHGPQCKQCRREGQKLMLKGERCKSEKCALERRPYPPGMRVTKRRRSSSEYNKQLREKQKLRKIYGILERQFKRYFTNAAHTKGVTGEKLLQILEQRLDNVVYRLGFAPSRLSARQLILHNHFLVNGKKTNIPSLQLKVGDIIEVEEKSRNLDIIHGALGANREVPSWLTVDKAKLTGQVTGIPDRASVALDIEEQLVVELYSK